jgi:hypothetical protein
MTFTELREYLYDECGCDVEHLEENLYLAKNCINGNFCLIQDLPFYFTATVCHYFYQLAIDVHPDFIEFANVYTNFRVHIKDVGFQKKK